MMKKVLRITAVFTLLVFFAGFLSGGLGALGWPVENAVLFRNFGYNDAGRPVLGMLFSGGTEVLAAESGEVIFISDGTNKASRLPSPFGVWKAIDHGDGLISIYSRYSPEELVTEDGEPVIIPTYVEKQQPVAKPGISGWSSQNGFYFMVYDRRERRWVNPSMIITPVQPNRVPQIFSVELRNSQGAVVRSTNLPQGRYTVYINASSPVTGRSNVLAPQYIVCSMNGAEVASLNFEAFTARDGVMMAYRNGLVPASRIYSAAPAYEAAEVFFSRGQATLELIVTNNAGNSARYVTRMYIN
jgi:hypothetical protein